VSIIQRLNTVAELKPYRTFQYSRHCFHQKNPTQLM